MLQGDFRIKEDMRIMNWEAIGAIGEVLGAIAVVLTLIYLATQIRQNTSSTRASTYSNTTDGWHTYMQSLTTTDIELLVSLATKPSELPTAEFYRGYYLCRIMFRRMEHDYYQFKVGTFEPQTWNAYVKAFREDTFRNPAVRAMWKLQSEYLDPSFREYMQPQVEEAATLDQQNVQTEFMRLLAEELHQTDPRNDDA
jgi:hypothetical protein